jgi:hypothetical protein
VNSPSNKPRNRFADPQNPEADLKSNWVCAGRGKTNPRRRDHEKENTNKLGEDGGQDKQTNKPTAERKVVYRNNTQFFKSPESNNDDISGLKFSRKKRSAESKSRERKKKRQDPKILIKFTRK